MVDLIIVESPYAGDIEANIAYAKRACLDCIENGETPFASHLFFPQFLNEQEEVEREFGIERGYEIGTAFYWTSICRVEFNFRVAFYIDNGWSPGMELALEWWTRLGAECQIRRLTEGSAANGSSQIDTPDEERA